MPREAFKPIELSAKLRPVAAPVDTFIRPQEPSRDTNLQDLARSLSNLGGSIGGLVGKRDQEAEATDKIRGEAAFWSGNGIGAADAVSQGLIPAQASPAFMRGFKETEGSVAGGILEQKFSAAYDSWAGKSSTDPAAFDAFTQSFLRENLKTDDPDVLRGLLPKVRQIVGNYQQRHIGDASRATMSGATTALAAKQDQALTDANTAGLASRQGTDYAGVFSRLDTIRAEGLATGMTEADVDKKLLDVVAARAIDLRDPKLLDFMSRKVPGKDYAWEATPYGRQQRQETLDKLETMGRRSIAEDEHKRREEKAAAKDAVTSATIAAILKDPRAPFSEELLARGEKLDADFRIRAFGWRDAAGRDASSSDPQELLAVTTDILNGGGLQRVQRAMNDKVFRNREDLERAYKLAEGMAKDGPKIEAVFSSDQSKAIERTIRERTLTQNDYERVLDPDGMSDTGLAAKHDYRMAILAWRQANPEANALEQQKAIAEIGSGILGRLSTGDMGGASYNRQGLTEANPFSAKPSGVEPPAAVPDNGGGQRGPLTVPNPMQPSGAIRGPVPSSPTGQAPIAQPGPQSAQPQAPADWFNGLPAEVRAGIERRAAEERKPLSLKMQEIYAKGISSGIIKPAPAAPAVQPQGVPGKQSAVAPDGTPIELASVTGTEDIGQAFREAIDKPPPADQVRLIGEAFERAIAGAGKGKPAGGYVSAQLRDDPRAARILDFVAGPESGGIYNAYFGHGDSTRDLSGMSLDQVMAWSQNRGTASSATGRYQFMAKTLKGLKSEMGLSGGERFTPELQDRLALQLLERRGYSDWQAGRITDAQFGNNLALEWASLPNITAQNGRPAGVSAYAGDGLNAHAKGLSPARVLAAITGGNREPGSTPPPGILGRLLGRSRSKPASRPGEGETGV